MREFSCDDELVKILEKYGSKEFTRKEDKYRCKRVFRKSKGSERCIKFDGPVFIFWSGAGCSETFDRLVVKKNELKSILWYMGCVTTDNYFITEDFFSVRKCEDTYRGLKMEHHFCTVEYPKPRNLSRVKRLLDSYDQIAFN